MPFIVLPEEWEKVLAFFRNNPYAVKYSKKIHDAKHSFVKLIVDDPAKTDSIFAIANKKYDGVRRLGKGSYGKVKRVKNSANKEFALKIEKGDENLALKDNADPSLQAARTVDFFKGQGLRILENTLLIAANKPQRKRYTLLELIEGETLFDIIRRHQNKPFLTTLQLYLLGLVSAVRILELHEHRIVHADVKAENIRGKIRGNKIFLKPLDYDFAVILKENRSSKTVLEPKGSKLYAAPELISQGRYSFASDIYALGVIFRYIELDDLSELMTAERTEHRLSLPLIISCILDKIHAEHIFLDDDAKEITSYALMKTKVHISMYLSQPRDLADLIDYKIANNYLSFDQCLIIGLLCCIDVLMLHRKKKILINIKPENFSVCLDPTMIRAEIKHIGYSCELEGDEKYVELWGWGEPRIPQEYAAPESKMSLRFSYATDVYSLGKLLKNLGIEPGLMISENPAVRPTLEQAIPDLIIRYATSCINDLPRKMFDEMARSFGIKIDMTKRGFIGEFAIKNIPALDMKDIDNPVPFLSPQSMSSQSTSPLSAGSGSEKNSSHSGELSPNRENTAPSSVPDSDDAKTEYSFLPALFNFKLSLNFSRNTTSKKEKKEKTEKQDKKRF